MTAVDPHTYPCGCTDQRQCETHRLLWDRAITEANNTTRRP